MDNGEVCDDGNTITEAECPYGSPTCTTCNATCSATLKLTGSYCGDSNIDTSHKEQCDFGAEGTWSSPYDTLIGPFDHLFTARGNTFVTEIDTDLDISNTTNIGHQNLNNNNGSTLVGQFTPLAFNGYIIDADTNARGNNWDVGCVLLGSLANADSGGLECWGASGKFNDLFGGSSGPAGLFKTVTTADLRNNKEKEIVVCATKDDDSPVCWSSDNSKMDMSSGMPTGTFSGIAMPQVHSHAMACAVPTSGSTPECWGPREHQYSAWSSTTGSFSGEIVGGKHFVCAIHNAGEVACRVQNGKSINNLSTVEGSVTNAVRLGADQDNLCALLADDTVICTDSDIVLPAAFQANSIGVGRDQLCTLEKDTNFLYCFGKSGKFPFSSAQSNLSNYTCDTNGSCQYCSATTCQIVTEP